MYPPSPHKLTIYILNELFVFQRLTVINIALCECETQQFATLVADKMQLKLIFHIATHFVEVEMLETSVVRRVVSLFSVVLFYAFG